MNTDSALSGESVGPDVLVLAKVVARLRSEIAALEGAVAASAVLEQANGVVMVEAGVSAEAAYDILLARSEQRRSTLMEECWITLGGVTAAPARTAPAGARASGAPDEAETRARAPAPAISSGRCPAVADATAAFDAMASGSADAEGPAILAGLARGLAAAGGPQDVAELLLTLLGAGGDLDAVMIYSVGAPGSLDLVAAAGIEEALARQWRHIPPLSRIAALEAVAEGRAVWLQDPARDRVRYELIGDPPERWPSRAWIPVSGAGRPRTVVGLFRTVDAAFDPATRVLWRRAVRLCAGRLRDGGVRGSARADDEDVEAVQRILDLVPASVILLTPLRDRSGEVEDYRIEAASPVAVDVAGRTGRELVGRCVLETYPTVAGTALWDGYRDTLTTGTPFESEPFTYREVLAGIPGESVYSVRASRLGGRLVVSWLCLDADDRAARRLSDMERLGNLGWAAWDLVTNTTTWSDHVYVIFGRDPAEGPITLGELPGHLVPDDMPTLAAAVQRLLSEGLAIDQPFHIRVGDGARYLRMVAEARTDVHGTPVEVHGFFQDLTAQRDIETALRDSERAVLLQRGMLQAERALAARLQNALLPIPEQSLEIAGLCIDVAYVPSVSGVNVGGDWYSAIELPDTSALFVVGDVAGHGLDAVATMAQLRFTAKGMAVTGSALPDVLARLNALLLHTASDGSGATATMVMARYQPWDHRLTWVRAGHLPPLLIRDGSARFLPLPEGGLLGASFQAVYTHDILDLQPGDHLVLYTDGLVEEPGEDIDTCLARLAEATLRLVEAGSSSTVARSLAAARQDRRDDVCVLALHVPAGPAPSPGDGSCEDEGARTAGRGPANAGPVPAPGAGR